MLISVDGGHNYWKMVGPNGFRVFYEGVLGDFQNSVLAQSMNGYIGFDGSHYLVGEDARLESISLIRGKDENWAFSDEYKGLLLYGLSKFIGPNTDMVMIDLLCSLPVLDYKRNRKELKDRFYGTHKITRRDARNCTLHIRNLEFLPQGFAPAISVFKNTDDRIVSLDLGSRNINYITIEKKRLINAHSSSEDIGLLPVLGDISKQIAEKTGRRIDPFDVYTLIENPIVRLPGEEVNVFSIVDYHLKAYTRSIISVISTHWGNAKDIMQILVSGGGSFLIGQELKKTYPQVRILDDPQWANAIYQYEYGKAKFR